MTHDRSTIRLRPSMGRATPMRGATLGALVLVVACGHASRGEPRRADSPPGSAPHSEAAETVSRAAVVARRHGDGQGEPTGEPRESGAELGNEAALATGRASLHDDFVGSWSQAALDEQGRPLVAWPTVTLDLKEDGTYRAIVLTGLTADGCGTFEGAGGSAGTWSLREDGLAHLHPSDENTGLALSFVGARLERVGEELRMIGGDRVTRLVPPGTNRKELEAGGYEMEE